MSSELGVPETVNMAFWLHQLVQKTDVVDNAIQMEKSVHQFRLF